MTFVGGATTALYIDDRCADARPTQDVDCAVQVASYAEFAKLEVELRTLGFLHHPGGPICRWLWRDTVVDVMPTDEAILGFANPWHREGMAHRNATRLPGGTSVHIFSLPYFLASKLAAFEDRGGGDWYESKDLEDVFAVLDGRRNAANELESANGPVRIYLMNQVMTARVGHRDREEDPVPLLFNRHCRPSSRPDDVESSPGFHRR